MLTHLTIILKLVNYVNNITISNIKLHGAYHTLTRFKTI